MRCAGQCGLLVKGCRPGRSRVLEIGISTALYLCNACAWTCFLVYCISLYCNHALLQSFLVIVSWNCTLVAPWDFPPLLRAPYHMPRSDACLPCLRSSLITLDRRPGKWIKHIYSANHGDNGVYVLAAGGTVLLAS